MLLSTAPWYVPRPHKLFLLVFETATWHVSAPLKSLQSSKPSAEACVAWVVAPPAPALASKYLHLGPANCFYWVSKLLRGTFPAPLKASKDSKAQNLVLQISKARSYGTMEPPYRPCKLFLLGFETATWHVLITLKSFKEMAAAHPLPNPT